ncbi:MerR family transcriptional regulator [Brachybacterium sp. GCM10030267]|uniref:MerR family transcriptional regulator n=1 Tax=Brachybacterium sp. GCM10030267 TaxID=3273381 RepID=UPI00361B8293
MAGNTEQEWSMQDVVRRSGTTSRTLRHYQQVGLLTPSRTGHGGQRFYDRDGLLRLQRILVLRELGLSLAEIGRVLEKQLDVADALREHVRQLERERERLAQAVASVRATLSMIETGGGLMAEKMFEGFDHTQYKDEVEERWGAQAYADSEAWWRSLDEAGKQAFQAELTDLIAAYDDAARRGVAVDSEEVRALTRRLYDWISAGWGGKAPDAEAFMGLGEMYVADPRFAKTFTLEGRELAPYVRDAMAVHAAEELA